MASPFGAALSAQFMQQKRARAESEVVKSTQGETVPEAVSAQKQDCSGAVQVRAKRSTAGKIRTNRFLDEDTDNDNASPVEKGLKPHAYSPGVDITAASKNKVVMQHALTIHAGDPEEGLWVGECAGIFRGDKIFNGAIIGDQYLAVGCDVFLKAAEPGQPQYVARIMRMFERSHDSAKMVTCKWFYRADETILAQDKKQLKQVSGQELFMSDIMDDNQLSAIEGLCHMRAAFLIPHTLETWLQAPRHLVYQSKYVPTEGTFKHLSAAEESEAKAAFAAAARSQRLTHVYRTLGRVQYASLRDDGEAAVACMRVTWRHEEARFKSEAVVCSGWKDVLRGTVYNRLAAVQSLGRAQLASAGGAATGSRSPGATTMTRTNGRGGRKSGGDGAGHEASGGSGDKKRPDSRNDGRGGGGASGGGGGEGGGGGGGGVEDSGMRVLHEHKRIQWIGDALPAPPPLPSTAAASTSTPPPKPVPGRRYYAKVLLANGSEVRIGAAVLLQAPEGEEAFLAQVEQLWENEGDGFKMMKCRWFYRASELRAIKPKQPKTHMASPQLPREAEEREVMCSDDVDDNYLTTIERPCTVLHLGAVPEDILGDWLRRPDNFFFRYKYSRHKKALTFVPLPPPQPSRTLAPSTSAASAPLRGKVVLSGPAGGGGATWEVGSKRCLDMEEVHQVRGEKHKEQLRLHGDEVAHKVPIQPKRAKLGEGEPVAVAAQTTPSRPAENRPGAAAAADMPSAAPHPQKDVPDRWLGTVDGSGAGGGAGGGEARLRLGVPPGLKHAAEEATGGSGGVGAGGVSAAKLGGGIAGRGSRLPASDGVAASDAVAGTCRSVEEAVDLVLKALVGEVCARVAAR